MENVTTVWFKTNLDQYSGDDFAPRYTFKVVPRKGDFVEVMSSRSLKFKNLKLPTRLEVVSVTWKLGNDYEPEAIVELWYNKTDLEMAKMSNAPVFG